MHFHSILSQLDSTIGATVTISRLDHALTNACYQLKTPTDRFVLRLNNPDSKRLGIDRPRERALLKAIAGQSFAPDIVEVTEHWLLSRWNPNRPEHLISDSSALLKLMSEVHQCQLSATIPPLLVSDQILHLSDQQQSPLSDQVRIRIHSLCEQYRPPQRLSLCFHDWHGGNLLGTDDRPILIDWEYAAPGDPAIDLACLCQGMKLNRSQCRDLARAIDLPDDRWQQAMHLTRLMSALWYGARFHHPLDPAILNETEQKR